MNEPYVANFPAGELRVHEPENGGMPKIEGTAVRWGSLSEDLGGFRERFVAGAFTDTLEDDDIRVVWQHDTKNVFGRVRAGTAEVWEDDEGLQFRAAPPDAQWAKDAIESIRRGDVDQNSFRFFVENRDSDQRLLREDGGLVREVLKAKLVEVGPQTTPAYLDTKVALRMLQEARAEGLLPDDVRIIGEPVASPDDERGHGDPDTLRRRLKRKTKGVVR